MSEVDLKRSAELVLFPVADPEVRMKDRAPLPEKEIRSLANASAQVRQDYFFRQVVDHHEIWTVWDGDELPVFEGESGRYFFVWPARDYAEMFSGKTIADQVCVPIPIDDFVDEVLFRDGEILASEEVAIFPASEQLPFIVMPVTAFLDTLVREWNSRLGAGSDSPLSSEGLPDIIKRRMKDAMKFGPKDKIPS